MRFRISYESLMYTWLKVVYVLIEIYFTQNFDDVEQIQHIVIVFPLLTWNN